MLGLSGLPCPVVSLGVLLCPSATCCSGSPNFTACSLLGWFNQDRIQTSLNSLCSLLDFQSLSEDPLLVLQTLSVTLLSHLLAPATLVWNLLWLLNHLCCPGLRRQLLLLIPALRFWLLFLLVLVTGSWCHIDSPVHDYLGHRGFAEPGLLVAGHELCVREGLDHRIRPRQSNYPIDSGAWCIVSTSLDPGSFRHLVPSLLQLAEYKDLLPFATASLQRPRQGATLRLRGKKCI